MREFQYTTTPDTNPRVNAKLPRRKKGKLQSLSCHPLCITSYDVHVASHMNSFDHHHVLFFFFFCLILIPWRAGQNDNNNNNLLFCTSTSLSVPFHCKPSSRLILANMSTATYIRTTTHISPVHPPPHLSALV